MTEKKEPTIHFDSKADAEAAIAEFNTLKNHPAWNRLERFLDEKLAYFASELRAGKLDNMDALYRLRDKMNLTEQFRNTPDIIITMIGMSQGTNVELDPYGKPEDETLTR
jgi:hypothetical protein